MWLLPALIAVGVLATAAVLWFFWFDTYHYAAVEPGVLYRDGVRGLREFKNAAHKAKPKTVISLVDANEIGQEPFKSEVEYCLTHGIRARTPADQARRVADHGGRSAVPRGREDPTRRPVLVHCAQGVRRTGMLVAAFQASALGYDKEKAKAAVLTFGHSRRSIGDVERFIDIYDPETRTVTADLPQSKESSAEGE